MKSMIYIMSPSYSGSTLLTFLLANHPEIATIGELKASALGDVDKYVCSCGDQLLECGFWEEVGRQMSARGNTFNLHNFGTHFRDKSYFVDRALRATVRGKLFETLRKIAISILPGCRGQRNKILHQNKELVDVISAIQNGKVFLDGSKDPVRLKHFHESGLWDLSVLFLVRDGRGVANSYMNHVGVSMEIAVTEWVRKCDEMYRIKRLMPESAVTMIKYEELCDSTDEVLESVFRYLGLAPEALEKEFGRLTHHILGNAMRLRSSGEIKLDEKWKRMLTHDDLATFERIGGEMNRTFGYS